MAKTLFILDQGLKNPLGHYFEYARSIGEAAVRKDVRCVVAGHKEADLPRSLPFPIHPIYSGGVWETLPGETYHSERNVRAVSESFVAETRRFVSERRLGDEDVLFLPNIATAHVLAAATLAEEYGPRGVHLHFMFRYPSHFFGAGAAAEAFRRLESAAAKARIILCTDSHRLAEDLASVTSLPFRVFPIPHTDHIAAGAHNGHGHGAPLHFISLGNARGEKGLGEIFDAVRKSAREPWADRVRFTLQVNDPSDDVQIAIAEFRRNPDPRVTLVDRILRSEEYYRLLDEADAVLTPYHRSIYRDRTSGVFLEAVMAGKIAICTRDTWMSDLLAVHGGGFAIPDRSPSALSAAIGEVVDNIGPLREKADQGAAHWKKIHSPENLVSHLTNGACEPVLIPTRRKAVIFFPWGDAVSGKSGAAARLRLLVRYLERQDFEVRVLFFSVSEPGGIIGSRTTAEPYPIMRIRNRVVRAATRAVSRMLGDKTGEKAFHLAYHLWPYVDDRLQKRCGELIDWADEVFLEYSYLGPIVDRLCRQRGKSFVLTQHDILSDQSKGTPFIHWATRFMEFRALRKAPCVVVASEADRQVCLDHKIAAELIPHPIDIAEGSSPFSADEARTVLACLHGLSLEGKHVCLFVGSAYGPNRIAAESVRSMAMHMREARRADDVFFIVVGRCLEPSREYNFAALGLVEDAVLSACYALADVIVIPLQEGTGASIKSVEALARGALVLSTSVGMRGLAVESGRHCIIEDDVSAFPRRILEILNDSGRANRLRAEAKASSASYHYGVVFERYGARGAHLDGAPYLENEELHQRKRRAVDDLLPRLRQIHDPKVRRVFGEQFDLTDAELPLFVAPALEARDDRRAGGAETEPAGNLMKDEASPGPAVPAAPAASGDSPSKHSLVRRIAKRALLLLPPVRTLYQQVLQANSRNAALERNLQVEKTNAEGRFALLSDTLREARGRNKQLENDHANLEGRLLARIAGLEDLAREVAERARRVESDRVALEARFLQRTTALADLLGEAQEQNERLEADRAAIENRFLERTAAFERLLHDAQEHARRLAADRTTLETRIAALQSALSDSEQCNHRLEVNGAALEARTAAVQSSLGDSQQRNHRLEAERAALDTRIAALQSSLSDSEQRNHRLGAERAALESRVVTLEASLSEAQKRNVLLEVDHVALEARLLEMTAALQIGGASLENRYLERTGKGSKVTNGREPALSAAICTYNRYDHLERAVASLLGQTLPDVEILVIDNSPDGLERRAAVAKYGENDRIRYITVDRPGLANARNVAAWEARGEALAFLDDDAIAMPVWAQALIDAFTSNGPEVKIVGGPVEPIYEIAPPLWLNDELAGHLTRVDWGTEPHFLRSQEWLAGANVAYLRRAYLDAGGCDVHLGRIGNGASLLSNEETELAERITRNGGRAFYTPMARVMHFVPAARLDRGWFRRRAMWQAISDQLVKDLTPDEAAKLRSEMRAYIASVPPELRDMQAFFHDVDDPTEFRCQLSSIYNFYRLTTAQGNPFAAQAPM